MIAARPEDKAVDASLPTLKFVPNWFVMTKMIKNLDDDYSLMMIIFVNEDSNYVTFLVIDLRVFLV